MQNCIRGNVKQIYFTFIKTLQRMFCDSLKDFYLIQFTNFMKHFLSDSDDKDMKEPSMASIIWRH